MRVPMSFMLSYPSDGIIFMPVCCINLMFLFLPINVLPVIIRMVRILVVLSHLFVRVVSALVSAQVLCIRDLQSRFMYFCSSR